MKWMKPSLSQNTLRHSIQLVCSKHSVLIWTFLYPFSSLIQCQSCEYGMHLRGLVTNSHGNSVLFIDYCLYLSFIMKLIHIHEIYINVLFQMISEENWWTSSHLKINNLPVLIVVFVRWWWNECNHCFHVMSFFMHSHNTHILS